MQEAARLIRELREKKGYPLRKVAAFLDIDQAILSKMERGKRKLSKEQIIKLARFYDYNEEGLLVAFLSDRIVDEIGDEDFANEALKVAEEKVAYLRKDRISRSEVVERIKQYFLNNDKVLKAWLFGSFAREEEDVSSDIDLMVEVEKNTKFTLFDLAEIQYQLEKSIPYKVDVVMKGALEPLIMNRIKPNIKLIYER